MYFVQGNTLQEIGNNLGLSRERIRQIKQSGIEDARQICENIGVCKKKQKKPQPKFLLSKCFLSKCLDIQDKESLKNGRPASREALARFAIICRSNNKTWRNIVEDWKTNHPDDPITLDIVRGAVRNFKKRI